MTARKKQSLLLLLILGAGIFACLFAWQYLRHPTSQNPPDPLLQAALEKASRVTTYAQEVTTEAIFPGRHLKIEGTYLIDRGKGRYSSVATTTVIASKGSSGASFTLRNISIDSEVYTRISSTDPAVQASFGDSGMWNHFSATAIPERFAGIAIPGPILDNLRILDDDGGFLSPIGTSTRDTKTDLTRYRFALAAAHSGTPAGTLQALMGHIADGTVDVWLDDDATVHMLAFNGPEYRSTTTISRLGEDLQIGPPPVAVIQ